jgi:hypothetical protein
MKAWSMKARTYLYIRFWGDEKRIFDDDMGLGKRERYVQNWCIQKMALLARSLAVSILEAVVVSSLVV